MSDNVAVTAGSGTTIAADEVVDGTLGTVKVQYVKIMDATLDGTTKAAVGAAGLKVDGSGATQPISAASLPLPALAATSTKQSDGTQKTQVVDGSGNVMPSGDTVARAMFEKITDGTNTAAVKAASTAPAATDPALVMAVSPNSYDFGSGTSGSKTQRVIVDSSQLSSLGQNTMSASQPVVMPSDFVGTSGFMKKEDVASADGDAGIPAMAIQQSSPADTAGTNGDYAMLQMSAGRLWASAKIDTAIPAGTNTMGQVGLVPVTSGGLTISSTLIASGTNATSVKASAGQLYKIEVTNNSANIGYLKIYNTAGTPTAGAGTPVIRLMCPGNASGTGVLSTFDNGVAFATGIGFTFTGGIADADTTSVAASAFIVNLYYK